MNEKYLLKENLECMSGPDRSEICKIPKVDLFSTPVKEKKSNLHLLMAPLHPSCRFAKNQPPKLLPTMSALFQSSCKNPKKPVLSQIENQKRKFKKFQRFIRESISKQEKNSFDVFIAVLNKIKDSANQQQVRIPSRFKKIHKQICSIFDRTVSLRPTNKKNKVFGAFENENFLENGAFGQSLAHPSEKWMSISPICSENQGSRMNFSQIVFPSSKKLPKWARKSLIWQTRKESYRDSSPPVKKSHIPDTIDDFEKNGNTLEMQTVEKTTQNNRKSGSGSFFETCFGPILSKKN